MTKFEEELRNKGVEIFTHMDGCTISKKVCINYADVVNLSEGWVSPEEHQARVDELIEAKEKYTKLLYENSSLKSQLQQQAQPVVKDFVAEWYEEHKADLDFSIFEACVSLYDDNSSDFKKWFGNSENKSIETLIRMKDGYTVEKPQLFYLKNKMTGDYLAICLARASSGLYVEATEKWLTRKEQTSYKLYFTQQEINSMQTGSYEQIEVAE